MNLYFCKTNLDMYSESVEEKLRENGFNTVEKYCLGVCGECMTGVTFLLEGERLCSERDIEDLIKISAIGGERL